MAFNDEELDLLLTLLETRSDLGVADLDGVGNALAYLLGVRLDAERAAPEHLCNTA